MNIHSWIRLYFIFFCYFAEASLDLTVMAQDFVLETKKIEIPGVPYAFNPSIISWDHNRFLMSFRAISEEDQKTLKLPCSGISQIGLVWLDEHLSPMGDPIYVTTDPMICRTIDDVRLVKCHNNLYLVSSGNLDPEGRDENFKMFVAEIDVGEKAFAVKRVEWLNHYEGEEEKRREKNWVPFDYRGNLLLAYSINPHFILYPELLGTESCLTISKTNAQIDWEWGELRGGTPALLLDEGRYLAFFHSTIDIATYHSQNQVMPHYFIGAYTFSSEPPFEITHISPSPIVAKTFYNGPVYDPYWKPVRVVFPCGFYFEKDYIWIVYGRQDHEIWIAKLDRKSLLESLVPVITSW